MLNNTGAELTTDQLTHVDKLKTAMADIWELGWREGWDKGWDRAADSVFKICNKEKQFKDGWRNGWDHGYTEGFKTSCIVMTVTYVVCTLAARYFAG